MNIDSILGRRCSWDKDCIHHDIIKLIKIKQ